MNKYGVFTRQDFIGIKELALTLDIPTKQATDLLLKGYLHFKMNSAGELQVRIDDVIKHMTKTQPPPTNQKRIYLDDSDAMYEKLKEFFTLRLKNYSDLVDSWELSDILGLSKTCLQNCVERKELKVIKVHEKKFYYPHEWILEFAATPNYLHKGRTTSSRHREVLRKFQKFLKENYR